jgi:hypothetical protein
VNVSHRGKTIEAIPIEKVRSVLKKYRMLPEEAPAGQVK